MYNIYICTCVYIYIYICICICVHTQSLSCVQLFVTLWTTAVHQAPLSMRFSRQEYWSGLPFSPLRDLPNTGIQLESPAAPALADGFFTTWEAPYMHQ